MDYLSDLFLLWARTGIYWDETPYHCSVCGETHKPRPGIVCRALMDKRLADHRAAMAQLINEFGMQNEQMVFCGMGYWKKAVPPKIVISVDAGSPENSISKLRRVKAFLDEMNAARKRRKRLTKKCATHERRKRLAMRKEKRLDAKLRKKAMRHPYWRGLPGKAKEALARNKYAHGSQQWAEYMICSLAIGSDETKAMHWFSSDIDDPSNLWCWECARKRLIAIRRESPVKLIRWLGWEGWNEAFFQTLSDEELCGGTSLIDGGWGTEEDGPRHCDGCGCRLDHSLTDYGVDQEIEYLEFHTPLDLRWANHWASAVDVKISISDDDLCWHRLIKIVLAALNKRHGKPTRLCSNARLKMRRDQYRTTGERS